MTWKYHDRYMGYMYPLEPWFSPDIWLSGIAGSYCKEPPYCFLKWLYQSIRLAKKFFGVSL